MRILAIIPSKGRPENIKKNILPFMARLGIDYRIFVEEREEGEYDFENIVTIPEFDQGLGYSLLCAKNYAKQNDYDLIFKIDDDVSAIGEIEEDLPEILGVFENPKYKNIAAVCFPYSFEFYSKSEALFTRLNKRLQTSYIIRTDQFRPSREISTFEDFYQFLGIRSRGKLSLLCSKHMIKCNPVGKGNGGLQDFDRSEMALKEINIFRRKDPKIKVVHKPNKPWKMEPKFVGDKYKSRPL